MVGGSSRHRIKLILCKMPDTPADCMMFKAALGAVLPRAVQQFVYRFAMQAAGVRECRGDLITNVPRPGRSRTPGTP